MASAPSPPSPRLSGLAQLGLLVGPLLSMVDSSIVTVAVVNIGRDLDSGLETVQWAVSGYLLALAAALAGTAWAARRFGTRRVYTISMAGFVLASAVCALAPNVAVLIAARAVQGATGAPLVPLAMSMLLGRRGAGRPTALASLLLFLGPALGPSLGGALVSTVGWRWIFLVNLPLGLLGLLGLLHVPAQVGTERDPRARFDPVSLAVLAGGLLGVLYGAHEVARHGSLPATAAVPLLLGTSLLGGYVVVFRNRPHPAVDLGLLRRGQSGLAAVLISLASLVITSTIVVLPAFAQTVQGYSALATGIALLPQGLMTALSTAIGQKFIAVVSIRLLVGGGFVLLAVSNAGLLLLQADTALWITGALLAGRAAAIGLVVSPLLVVSQQDNSPEEQWTSPSWLEALIPARV